MFKTRDFYLMKVFDIKGKYVGLVSDLNIDFYNGKVLGFFISNYTLFSKRNYIDIDDIVSMGDVITTKGIVEKKGLPFRKIKDLDIYDMGNVMKGVLEDILIDTKDFSIKGLIVSSGIFDKMLKGKEILLIQNCILGDRYILYKGSGNISLKTLPHNVAGNEVLKKA
ncbi:MAG: PRC-barrel domain-containing protein [Clostridium sp.]